MIFHKLKFIAINGEGNWHYDDVFMFESTDPTYGSDPFEEEEQDYPWSKPSLGETIFQDMEEYARAYVRTKEFQKKYLDRYEGEERKKKKIEMIEDIGVEGVHYTKEQQEEALNLFK